MKRSDLGFKILSVTLIALLILVVLNRFVHSTFSMVKAGQVFRYKWDLWRQYWEWLPGKVLCISFVLVTIILLIEAVYFIFFKKTKKK
jgi:hypothetical protein